jgi:hypothetical protein
MKICETHWAKLRQALKDRGIDHLGAKTGEEAFQNITDQLDGTKTEYDPLMDCNMMIWSAGIEMGGLYLMDKKEDGSSHCPICEAVQNDCGDEKYWIDGPADAALSHCRELRLVSLN